MSNSSSARINVTIQAKNVVNITAEGVVTSEDGKLKHPSMITDALCRVKGGGEEFRQRRLKQRDKRQNLKYGDVFYTRMTDYRSFPFSFVLHGVLSKYQEDQAAEWMDNLYDLNTNILKEADELQLKSIAVPFLGTGFRGSEPEIAVEIAVRSVADYNPRHLEVVHFVSMDKTPIIHAKYYCESLSTRHAR